MSRRAPVCGRRRTWRKPAGAPASGSHRLSLQGGDPDEVVDRSSNATNTVSIDRRG